MKNNKLWEILLPIFTILIASAYSAIKIKNPTLPIVESDFVELVLWIITSAISGIAGMRLKIKLRLDKRGKSYEQAMY